MKRIRSVAWGAMVVVTLLLALSLQSFAQEAAEAQRPEKELRHPPELQRLLANLTVDEPRVYKGMIVFPIRWSGRQAPGDWETMDDAVAAQHLKISEKEQAQVSEVTVENVSDRTIFLLSGEIIAGGQQTRMLRQDVVIEPKQTVVVPVFCVEHGRWSGGKGFSGGMNRVPASINDAVQRGAAQGEVWQRVEEKSATFGADSETGNLNEVLESEDVQREMEAMHEELGKFSPEDTIGLAVADRRTGRIVGLELFGRRDLFEKLQAKLIEGYAADLVVTRNAAVVEENWEASDVKQKAVAAFIGQLLKTGESGYEDTPGSGRGVALKSGRIVGKGVALGETTIHISIQDVQQDATPAKPIVRPERPVPMRMGPEPRRQLQRE